MDRLNIGVISDGTRRERGLTAAAWRDADVVVQRVEPGEAPSSKIAGLIIDLPLDRRAEIVPALVTRWRVPILVELPVATSPADAVRLQSKLNGGRVASFNPLAFHVPTKRMKDDITASADPLETLYASWRFHSSVDSRHAGPQLIDYVCALTGEAPYRLAGMQRTDPMIALALLRFPNGVVANLEVGQHLPSSMPVDSELIIESFCHDSVYHCVPENQSITVDGSQRHRVDWSPDPADAMLRRFLDAIRSGDQLRGDLSDDIAALTLWQNMLDDARGLAESLASVRSHS